MNWWASLYSEAFAEAYMDRTGRAQLAQLDATIDFLTGEAGLEPRAPVFDQCCGTGELAVGFARRGHTVHGLDQASHYIERARARARGSGVADRMTLRVADAFQTAAPSPCALAFNWWSGFGYADTDQENLRMLQRGFDSLAPGGRYVVDTMNAPQVLREFDAYRSSERDTGGGRIRVEVESEVELASGTLVKRWRLHHPDQTVEEVHSRVRLYGPHELVALFERAGFERVRLLGAVDGRPLALDSPRCIVSGARP